MDEWVSHPFNEQRVTFIAFQYWHHRLDIPQRFVELLTPFWIRQQENVRKESRTLAALRDALLPSSSPASCE